MKDPAAALSSLMLVLLGWTLLVVSCSDAEPTIDASIIHLPGEGDAPSGPVMAWDATTRDLGIVAAGSSHGLSYTVTNAGDAPMVITQVLPSCGCTVAEAWRDTPIAPGESETVVLHLDAGETTRTLSESATVVTNAVPASIELTFTADVLGPDRLPDTQP